MEGMDQKMSQLSLLSQELDEKLNFCKMSSHL